MTEHVARVDAGPVSIPDTAEVTVEAIRKHPVAAFFFLTYAISWSLYAVIIGLRIRVDTAAALPLFLPAISGPTVAAIILTGAGWGRRDLAALLRRALRWRVHIGWYVAVLAFWAVGLVLIWTAARIVGLELRPIDDPPLSAFPFLFLVILLIGGPLQEEFGWRGFALPRLQKGRTALRASIILGLFWGVWHVPVFWVAGTWHADLVAGRSWSVTLFFVAIFVLSTVPLSIVYAWVYNGTGSLLLTILLHASMNTIDTWAPWPADQRGAMTWAGLQLAYLVVAALIAVALGGPARLTRRRQPDAVSAAPPAAVPGIVG
jgi:membrane protease YdiL (CAAX protease family)